MSLSRAPCKTEVMEWSPANLANYMGKLKLSGCDRLVLKQNISGARFMEMTVSDLHVFPSLYVPLVAKIQSEIKKRDQKKATGNESEAEKNPRQAVAIEQDDVASDESDNGSDNDYEEEEEKGRYICALPEPLDNEDTYEVAIKSSPSADTRKAPQRPREVALQDGLCRDSVSVSAEKPSKPPVPQRPLRKNPPPPRPVRAPAGPPTLHNEKSGKVKPARPCGPSQAELPKSKSSAVKADVSSQSVIPRPRAPKPTDVPNREGKVLPAVAAQPAEVNNSIPRQSMDLDPSWYQGKVTRRQAEVALREVNKDGAFVVRASSRGTDEHPFTLMLLKQGKVYNIMIRRQGNSYTLGSGLKQTRSFPGVKEMIDHHANTPLLLLDYMERSAEPQSWCCLLHPAGLGGGDVL
ncbi:lymphocyte cytosolic protein 2 [Pungitius pungitius]|uniref:lymphocyte cytosolic protein 2 n=1 Tax=Pungitius pungitius TaxID=134920 RepID=UPI002E124537